MEEREGERPKAPRVPQDDTTGCGVFSFLRICRKAAGPQRHPHSLRFERCGSSAPVSASSSTYCNVRGIWELQRIQAGEFTGSLRSPGSRVLASLDKALITCAINQRPPAFARYPKLFWMCKDELSSGALASISTNVCCLFC